MNINFNKIIIKNFLSIGYAELDLNNLGYVLVQGRNLNIDDNATSNGSGKSSIFESISWVLTGETIRGVKSNISNIKSNSGAYVEIDFTLNEKSIKIIRTKDDENLGTTLKLYINGKDKSGKGIRDTTKILSEYLPDLTSSLIGSVIILGQNLQQRFSNNSPSGRKEVLESLTKSDFMIQDLKDRVSNRKQSLSDKLDELRVSLSDVQNKKAFYLSQLEEINEALNNSESKDRIENDIKKLSEELEDRKNYLCIVDNSILKEQSVIRKLREEYSDIFEEKLKTEKKYSDEKNDIVSSISSKYEKLLKEVQDALNSLNVEYATVCSEIGRILSITDVCPTCGQKLVGVEKPDTSELIKKKEKIYKRLTTKKELYDEYLKNKEKELSSSIDSLTNKYSDKINSVESEIKKIIDDGKYHKEILEKKENERVSVVDKINSISIDLSVLKNNLQNFEDKVSHLKKSKKSISDDIVKFDDEILYINSRRENLKDRLDIVNKFGTVVSRDFRGFLLKNLIDYIDKTAKEYSECVFDTDKILFSLNGNNIDISYCNKSYENLSSGERQKVDIIIQFSIRDMLCRCLGFSCNILVLDEIFDGLDSIGCQKVIELISNKISDIQSIFVVTHRADLSIPYDRIILVEKDNRGISTVNDIL